MDSSGVTVLLVGGMSRNTSPLERHLLKCGCKLSFASSKNEATELLESHSFHLVLSEYMLPDGTAYQLIPPLLGTNTTMFFSNPAEDSCWWMTVIIRGEVCSVQPTMRPREFTVLLDKTLSELQFPNRTLGEHKGRAVLRTKQAAEKAQSPGRLVKFQSLDSK